LLERSFTVDVLKVVAAQFIVWHHLSAYGPMADTMNLSWPHLIDWLYHSARLAVQVFLVVGGFLAGQSVMNKPITHPLLLIIKRYLRLVPFYILALALISIAVSVSRTTIHASWLPSVPTVWQFLAHGLLANDLLGFEALSSGAWYVAVDFQLYMLLILLCHSLQTTDHKRLSIGVALLCIASMWQFNRVDALDIWAIYFFAAYGLGVLAAWSKRSKFDVTVFWLTALMAIGALWLEYRTRLSLALATAVWLAIKPKILPRWTPMKRVVHRLSNSAYVLFLTHFGVIVLFSAMWNTSHFYDPTTAFAVTAFAWFCSVGLGLFLHEKAEVPLHHWVSQHSKQFLLPKPRVAVDRQGL
jgi:peptidoglycan/LPS O-acetylase OafA/YrhL